MEQEQRIAELESKVLQLNRDGRRHAWRSRWAAIGAAVAITFGGGTVLHYAMAAPGDVVGGSFVPVSPARILDTRPAPQNVGGFVGPLVAGQTHTFQVTGVAGVPVNATAVVMNMTVDQTTGSSFLTVFPAGAAQPTASNLNWTPNVTIPNLVTVKIGAAGKVSVYNNAGNAQVIADVAGYYIPGNDKFFSLDVTDVAGAGTATFVDGFGANAGLRFTDTQDTSFHIVLPPDYTPGAAIVGTFTWHTASVACNVFWRANYTSVSRTGQVHVVGALATSGMSDPGVATVGGTPNLVQTSTFTLSSPLASFTLQPGDSYTFGLFRNATAGDCAGFAAIDSMVIRYE